MRKRHLEMALSNLGDLEEPDSRLEQYRTPPGMVADILWRAMENGDVIGKDVIELGCGGSPFALGAMLLGCRKATGLDKDPISLELSRTNLRILHDRGMLKDDVRLETVLADIKDVGSTLGSYDTVFMNPPFGAQKKHADRPFIEVACKIARSVYSIHNGSTGDFITRLFRKKGFEIEERNTSNMTIPHRFDFHTREMDRIEVLIINARSVDP
jgi:putative methylase